MSLIGMITAIAPQDPSYYAVAAGAAIFLALVARVTVGVRNSIKRIRMRPKLILDLRKRLASAQKQMNRPSSAPRETDFSEVCGTVRAVSLALLDRQVTVRELEPEIDRFPDIMQWIWCEIGSGRVQGLTPGSRDALTFGSVLLEQQVFYDMLRLDPEHAWDHPSRTALGKRLRQEERH